MSFTYPILAQLACLSTAALASPAPLDFTGHLAESFDALPTSGTLTLPGTGTPGFQAPLPGAPGWHIARVGGSATTDLTLATSPSTTARLYAFGLADSPDRALGALASASAASAFGLALRNASPLTFQALTLHFTQEIWLTQGTSTSQPFADRLRFAWGIDPANTTPDNFLTHPALTPLPDLDALSPPQQHPHQRRQQQLPRPPTPRPCPPLAPSQQRHPPRPPLDARPNPLPPLGRPRRRRLRRRPRPRRFPTHRPNRPLPRPTHPRTHRRRTPPPALAHPSRSLLPIGGLPPTPVLDPRR